MCPLVRDSEPIRLLEIPTSPSLYKLILNIKVIIIVITSQKDSSNSYHFKFQL